MKHETEQSTSAWMATASVPDTPMLTGDEQADVCIIGAGIAGLTTAYLLAREGKSVVVLDDGPCIRFPDQGQFHPLKYLNGVAKAIERTGGKIFSNAHATRVEGGGDAHVETKAGPVVRCSSIVVATNTPFIDRVAIHTKQA